MRCTIRSCGQQEFTFAVTMKLVSPAPVSHQLVEITQLSVPLEPSAKPMQLFCLLVAEAWSPLHPKTMGK